MKTATQNLEDDHVHILHLIEIMELITHKNTVDVAHLDTIVQIIREFADGQHHAKEEQLLFPLLVEKGFSTENGPVAVMLHDHVQGREFVKEMTENILLMKNGNQDALQNVFSNMLGYSDLLKNHITKENNVLFRMADQVISQSEQDQLLHEFKQIELGNNNDISKIEYADEIKKLQEFYGLTES
jgi:hemerythrin-like domain-containing protein